MQLKVLDGTPAGIRVLVEGREHTLEPMVARNITVHLIADQNGHEEEAQTLAEVRPGYEATVIRISSRAQGPQRRRLLDLGIVPGTTISAELESATRDPVAYRVRGAVIALRRAQADTIYVEHIRPVDTEIVEATRAGAL
jgi:DtxR family Mn-dependent transcriptional regulator